MKRRSRDGERKGREGRERIDTDRHIDRDRKTERKGREGERERRRNRRRRKELEIQRERDTDLGFPQRALLDLIQSRYILSFRLLKKPIC